MLKILFGSFPQIWVENAL